MTTPGILDSTTIDWTYDDVAEELEHLAIAEDLEPPEGPSLADLEQILLDSDLAHVAGDLQRIAELAAR